jgi:hypothetical protein
MVHNSQPDFMLQLSHTRNFPSLSLQNHDNQAPKQQKNISLQMALSLRDRSPLKPEIRLAQAVSEFEAILTSEQKVSFSASRSSAASRTPSMSDVMRLTAEIDLKTTSKHGRVRCLGPRMTNVLQSVQQFAALGDVVIGGSQNLIACGVWAAARLALHVRQWPLFLPSSRVYR